MREPTAYDFYADKAGNEGVRDAVICLVKSREVGFLV